MIQLHLPRKRLTRPLPISAIDLAEMTVPICVARGGLTRPVFAVVATAAARAVPHAWHLIVPNAAHMWPLEQPEAFCKSLEAFWDGPACAQRWSTGTLIGGAA